MLSEIKKLENEMKEFASELYPELNVFFIHQPSTNSTTSGIYSSSEKKVQMNWSVITNNLEKLQELNATSLLKM